MGSIFVDGSPPDKLFRCKNSEERVGLKKSEVGMAPLNLFMLTSRYTNSDCDSRPLSGPHIEFIDTDK